MFVSLIHMAPAQARDSFAGHSWAMTALQRVAMGLWPKIQVTHRERERTL